MYLDTNTQLPPNNNENFVVSIKHTESVLDDDPDDGWGLEESDDEEEQKDKETSPVPEPAVTRMTDYVE